MGDARRRRCKDCKRTDSDVGELSWNGLCSECQSRRMNENNDSIHVGYGPGHERRLEGYARKLYGPRVALALKQAGVFASPPLDDVLERP